MLAPRVIILPLAGNCLPSACVVTIHMGAVTEYIAALRLVD